MKMKNKPQTEIKEVLKFLLKQWCSLTNLAAIEALQLLSTTTETDSSVPAMVQINFAAVRPILRIEIIKAKIIDLFPQAICILPCFENELDLSPDDFIEMYIQHQKMSVEKVNTIIKQVGL